MGNYNCCGRKDRNLNENEEIFLTPKAKKVNVENNVKKELQTELEGLQTFDLTYDNIINYFDEGSQTLPRVDPISKEDLDHAVKIQGKEGLLVIHKRYVVKVISIEENNDRADNYGDKIITKNVKNLKEIRVIKDKMKNNAFIVKCCGYFLDEDVDNSRRSPQSSRAIYLKYNYYENSLENFIKNRSANFENKVKLFRTLIELIKKLHSEGIISTDLSINNIRFTPKFQLKLVNFGNSFNFNSCCDIDRLSQFNYITPDLHYAPEILLLKTPLDKGEEDKSIISWHSDIWSLGVILAMLFSDEIIKISPEIFINNYQNGRLPEELTNSIERISDIYIKSIIVGLLRVNPEERPTIFEIVDIFNKFVEKMKYDSGYIIPTSKNEIYGKITSFMHFRI